MKNKTHKSSIIQIHHLANFIALFIYQIDWSWIIIVNHYYFFHIKWSQRATFRFISIYFHLLCKCLSLFYYFISITNVSFQFETFSVERKQFFFRKYALNVCIFVRVYYKKKKLIYYPKKQQNEEAHQTKEHQKKRKFLNVSHFSHQLFPSTRNSRARTVIELAGGINHQSTNRFSAWFSRQNS